MSERTHDHWKTGEERTRRASEPPDRLYAVVLYDPDNAYHAYHNLARAVGASSLHRVGNDSLFLVSVDDTETTSKQIAEWAKLGKHCPGVVFRMGIGYFGFAPRRLWSWLNANI